MTDPARRSDADDDRVATVDHFRIPRTPGEGAFDALAQLASHICAAPIAAISIIDEHREWSIGRVGIDAWESPRTGSFGDVAVSEREPLVVRDTGADERYRHVRGVADAPYLRSYAAAPLIAPNGRVLGTIWVGDREPRQFGAGEVDGLLALSRYVIDVLELRRLTAERDRTFVEQRHAQEYARRLQSFATQLLATVGHEIAAPTNEIVLLADILLRAPVRGGQRRFAEMISSSATALRTLVDELADFTKLDAGTLRMTVREFDLHALVERSAELLVGAKFAGIQIACFIRGDVPRYVRGDETRIRQVIMNLLADGVKRGGLALEVELIERGLDHSLIRFSIEASQSVDDAPVARDGEGFAGHQLAIAKLLVVLMGGRSDFESVEGRGSTFRFTLRLDDPLRATAEVSHGAPGRVLLAGSPGAAANASREALRRAGYVVAETETARGAYDSLRRAVSEGDRFGVAIVWTPLADMSAAEFAEILAGDEEFARLPLVLVNDAPVALEPSDFWAVVETPIATQLLLDSVRAAFRAPESAAPSPVDAMELIPPRAPTFARVTQHESPISNTSENAVVTAALAQLEMELGTQSVGRLCAIFLEDTELRRKRLAEAIRDDDGARVRAEVHAVRGSCANFRAKHAIEASDALLAEADHARLDERYLRLDREIQVLQQIVRSYAG